MLHVFDAIKAAESRISEKIDSLIIRLNGLEVELVSVLKEFDTLKEKISTACASE